MAGCAADLLDAQQDGVVIAVQPDAADFLHMAGRPPLVPELATAAAPVMGLARGQRALPGLLIHVRQHEHFSRRRILSDGRYEPLAEIRAKRRGHRWFSLGKDSRPPGSGQREHDGRGHLHASQKCARTQGSGAPSCRRFREGRVTRPAIRQTAGLLENAADRPCSGHTAFRAGHEVVAPADTAGSAARPRTLEHFQFETLRVPNHTA